MGTWVKEAFTFQDLQRIMSRLIDRVPVFAELSQQELIDLLANAEKCTFGPGDAILNEGSTGHFMYVMMEGAATVAKKDRHGNPASWPRSAQATASARCRWWTRTLARLPSPPRRIAC